MNIKYLILVVCFLISACGSSNTSEDVKDPIVPEKPETPVKLIEPDIGLGIFGLLNPKFPVNDAIELLSVKERPMFSFLYGTFGENPQNFVTLVDALQEKNLSPYVGLYAICGPCREPRRDGSLLKFERGVDIPTLNERLVNDPATQERYRNYLLDIKNNIVNLYPELSWDIYPELESNMDLPALSTTFNIATEVFSDIPNVRIVINHLENQRLENQPLEIHTDWIGNLSLIGKDDIISLDGSCFDYPNEHTNCIDYDEVKQLIIEAKNKGVLFYIWRPEWQGLQKEGSLSLPVDERTYVFPNKEYLKELLLL